MSTSNLLIYAVVLYFGFYLYQAYLSSARVRCSFTRRDKTIVHKWAKAKNGERIEFDGGWYYVVMKCVTLESKGFPLFTQVRHLDYTYKSSYPMNPETGEPYDETPEMRKNLNKREDIEALNKGTQQAFGKGVKAGFMGGGILPVILIIAVVACLYLSWQNSSHINMLGAGQNVMESMLGKIQQSLPH